MMNNSAISSQFFLYSRKGKIIMDKRNLESYVEAAINRAYDDLTDKINAAEGKGAVKFANMLAIMYRDSIEQSVKIVIRMLEKEDVVKLDSSENLGVNFDLKQ